jgi:AcrR family transcriptional regulator
VDTVEQTGVTRHTGSPTLTTAARPPYRRSLLQQERSLNTRRAILRAAVGLLGTQDFSATTVEDICAAAGIGRSTFYLYFESRDQLLMELAEATARGVSDDVDSWVGAGTVDDAIGVFIDGLVRRMETAPPRLAALVMRRVSAANVTPRPVPGDPILFDDILTGIAREAQRRGEIKPGLDPREVGEVLAGMTLDALQRWAAEDGARPLRDRLDFRLNTFLEAVRTAPRAPDRGG